MRDRVSIFRNSKIYLYGAGKIGHEVTVELKNDIDGIFDRRYEELRTLNGIPIMNPAEIMNLNPVDSILIFSVGMNVADSIMQLVEGLGWVRNINLYYYSDFMQNNLMEYYLGRKNKLYIPDFTISITTKCSLKCKNCSQQLHRIKDKSDRNINDLKKDLSNLFRYVDYVDNLAIIGGEPFAHSKLNIFLKELVKYRSKYKKCRIVTNATILPSKDILIFMAQNNIYLELTRYNVAQSKIEVITKQCKDFNVQYNISDHEYWLEMWNETPKLNDDEVNWIFKNFVVKNHCAGMINGYITVCTCAFMYMLGKDNFCESDYLDLYKTQSKETILEYLSANMAWLTGCKYCNGLYGINDKKILVGEQLK